MKDVTPVEFSKAEARKLTKKIKEATDHLWYLLVDAREGKAWKALGYSTWDAYVKAEFGMGRSRSYQLLDQGKVVEALRDATGDLSTDVDISEAAARDIKADLPEVVEEIRARVEQGEDPKIAISEAVDAKRVEKAAQQAENDKQREEHAAALSDEVKQHNKAKADAIAARKATPVDVDALIAKNEELQEANAALETEVAALKVDNTKWEGMRVQFEQGGFEKVIAGKDEEIRVLLTRVEAESQEKLSNLRSADRWRKRAIELGYGELDCALVLGRWWAANHGVNPAAHLIGTYNDADGCADVLMSQRGLLRLVFNICRSIGAKRTSDPQPGDFGVVRMGRLHFGAIRTRSGKWAIKGCDGLIVTSQCKPVVIWSI